MAFGWLKSLAPIAGAVIGSAILPGVGTAIGGGLGNAISKVGKYAPLALGAASAVSGAKAQGKQNKINDQLLAQVQADNAAKAKARDMALASIQQPIAQSPNLARLFAGSQNPFSRAA